MNRQKCECEHQFTPASMKLTVHEKIGTIITRRRVCGQCWNKFYLKNEGDK